MLNEKSMKDFLTNSQHKNVKVGHLVAKLKETGSKNKPYQWARPL